MLIWLSPSYQGTLFKIVTSVLVARVNFCILMNCEYFTSPNVHWKIELRQCKFISC